MIKVKSNQSKRTFTIKKDGSKYRTSRMSVQEFEEMEMNTLEDWKNFLNTSEDYYLVKIKTKK